MKLVSLNVVAALGAAALAGSVSRADEAPTTPVAATTPSTPAATTPACAVSGPGLEDRRAALRTGLPSGKTIIALDLEQRRALPDGPLPDKVRKRLKAVGAFFGPLDEDGSLSVKSMWRKDLRRATGKLRVTGKRLDGPGRFSVDLNPDYSERRSAPFVPGSLVFSTTGCWQITGRAGKARVTYVALVRRPEPGEFAPHLP